MKTCRVCNARTLHSLGSYYAYKDFCTIVYDCETCGCRLTDHDASIHERLHAVPSSYSWHADLAEQAKLLIASNKLETLEKTLCKTEKYSFIIRAATVLPQSARILELGCSHGYMTAFLNNRGYKTVGIDVSQTALASATNKFGPHFYTPEDPEVRKNAPYDMIFHVGTIGCVPDPVSTTTNLLRLLKPGGRLIFNAPNRTAADALGIQWIYGTQPPDLVTLFPEDFWEKTYGAEYLVNTTVTPNTQRLDLLYRYAPRALIQERRYLFEPDRFLASHGRRLARRFMFFFFKLLTRLMRTQPLKSDFGMYVTIQRP